MSSGGRRARVSEYFFYSGGAGTVNCFTNPNLKQNTFFLGGGWGGVELGLELVNLG